MADISHDEVMAIMRHYDKDASGLLDQGELLLMIKALKKGNKELDAAKILATWDTNADGKVDEAEFSGRINELAKRGPELKSAIKAMASTYQSQQQNAVQRRKTNDEFMMKANELFAVFDTDKNNYLDAEEVKIIVQSIKPQKRGKEAAEQMDMDKIMSHWDADGDKKVTRSEFYKRLTEIVDIASGAEDRNDRMRAMLKRMQEHIESVREDFNQVAIVPQPDKGKIESKGTCEACSIQ